MSEVGDVAQVVQAQDAVQVVQANPVVQVEDAAQSPPAQANPVVQAPAVQAPPAVPVVQANPAVQANPVAHPAQPKNLQITADQVQVVVDGISNLLRGRKLSEALLIRVVANCMVMTARMKVQNHLKKEIVVVALERYIREKSDLSQDEIDVMMALVDVMVSDAIDTIADVRKGQINLSTKACCNIM